VRTLAGAERKEPAIMRGVVDGLEKMGIFPGLER
jgi:hypothetical protein